ncbi:hypothetical protein [Microbulbifer hainanensis]|uniref:hypothetical protein n=1 Tax=Microbulbifer hainanensis TaxID=2735675 RepID=UPI001866704C|nr:hypothetical protein [Microbulbifer hainanensis]
MQSYTIQELHEALLGIDEEKNQDKVSELKQQLREKQAKVSDLKKQIAELEGSAPAGLSVSEPGNPMTFKRLFLASCCSIGAFWLLLGIFGLFGFDTININGEAAHGVPALIGSVVTGAIFSLVLSGCTWIGAKVLEMLESE